MGNIKDEWSEFNLPNMNRANKKQYELLDLYLDTTLTIFLNLQTDIINNYIRGENKADTFCNAMTYLNYEFINQTIMMMSDIEMAQTKRD